MKPGYYISRVTCSNEGCEAAFVVFRVCPWLLSVVQDARRALKALEKTRDCYGSVTLRGCVNCCVVTYSVEERVSELFPGLKALPEDEEVLYVGPEFDANTLGDGEYWRSECHGVEVDAYGACIVALAKNSSYEVTSFDITDTLETKP